MAFPGGFLMKLISRRVEGREEIGVLIGDVVVSLEQMNHHCQKNFEASMQSLLESSRLEELQQTVLTMEDETKQACLRDGIPLHDCELAPLYRRPRKIWGIGLNYVEHAGDLKAVLPTEEPASFMKADTTLIGPSDVIELPWQSERVTAEAEIGVVIGKECRDVRVEEAASYVAGFVAVIDMTAEDILQKNPRFLTRAKNFDTFFSLGGELQTVDEIPDLASIKVGTYNNGHLHRENIVANMTFNPWYLVSFHSQVMTLLPGDIISTGTPGAVVIHDGDMAECRIDGFLPLINPVRQRWAGPKEDAR